MYWIFTTLEERIADLPRRKEPGDAFELYVKACICTQAIHRAAEVWPQDIASVRVLRELNAYFPEGCLPGRKSETHGLPVAASKMWMGWKQWPR